jgi:ACR3 family arsenite transporter
MPEVLPSDGIVASPPTESHSQTEHSSPAISDIEKQRTGKEEEIVDASKTSAFKSLGWLDRFLALWIFLAMAVGIILGNFVPNTGPALQKGEFVGVSIPIGEFHTSLLFFQVLIFELAVGLLVMMYPILCKVGSQNPYSSLV